MTYYPTHRTQLWRPVTGSVDCGPRSWQMAIDHATRGKRFVNIDRLRQLGGRPGAQPTNVYNGSDALSALGIRHDRIVGGPWDDALDALRQGAGVTLCITYGVLNDLNPWVSGSESFRGGHSIYVQGLRRSRRDGRRRTRSFDSLYDGRRAGIPDGPRAVRIGMLQRAAEAFAGRPGRWWGLIVPVARDAGGPGLPERGDELLLPVDPAAEPEEGTPLPPGSSGDALAPIVAELPDVDDDGDDIEGDAD